MKIKRIKKNKSIMLVGGGTGGHVVPIFEVYKNLLNSDSSLAITVIGSGTDVELNFFKRNPNYKIVKTGKLRRQYTLKNLVEFFSFLRGLVQSYLLLWRLKPSLIFSKGGYVSVPIIFWAKKFKIPYFIHESDTEMGVANKYAARSAEKIFLGFPIESYKDIPVQNSYYSGQIIRADFVNDDSGSKVEFGFDNSDPVILVTGGSQGSLNINKNFVKAAEELLKKYNIVQQTGVNDYEWVKKYRDSLAPENQAKYYVADFLKAEDNQDKMVQAINIADLVIARAGANTISELAVKGKAMILVPYKYAAGDHQTKNAKILEKEGAAIIIEDDSFRSDKLLNVIINLNSDQKKIELLGKNAKNLFAEDGLKTITKEILDWLTKKEEK